jgi:hypothetical protein
VGWLGGTVLEGWAGLVGGRWEGRWEVGGGLTCWEGGWEGAWRWVGGGWGEVVCKLGVACCLAGARLEPSSALRGVLGGGGGCGCGCGCPGAGAGARVQVRVRVRVRVRGCRVSGCSGFTTTKLTGPR